MTDETRKAALKLNADALAALNDSMTVLVAERWALLEPTEEEKDTAAEMAEEDGRDAGLYDSVSDAYWTWILCDGIELMREDSEPC